jgi:V8-like Glu-specific endopeptidase
LITPNLVVTARHCVSQTDKLIACATSKFGGTYQANSFWITTDQNLLQSQRGWVQAQKVITTPGSDVCGNDLALIILKSQISPNVATPAIPAIKNDLTDRARISATLYTAIGYGVTGPNAQDSGTRRIKQDISLLCLPGDKFNDCTKSPNFPANVITPKEFIGDKGTCSGDSGSGAFNQNAYDLGQFLSMGVLSRGGEEAGECVQATYTRLDSWRDLIVSAATEASKNWTLYPKPDWTVYEPPAPDEPKDAGPKKDTGASSSSSGQNEACPDGRGSGELGSACEEPCNCADEAAQCTTAGASTSNVCTKSCEADADCGDGFTCAQGLCAVPAAPAPPAVTQDAPVNSSASCAMTTGPGLDPTKPVPWRTLGFVAAVGTLLAARRTRRR